PRAPIIPPRLVAKPIETPPADPVPVAPKPVEPTPPVPASPALAAPTPVATPTPPSTSIASAPAAVARDGGASRGGGVADLRGDGPGLPVPSSALVNTTAFSDSNGDGVTSCAARNAGGRGVGDVAGSLRAQGPVMKAGAGVALAGIVFIAGVASAQDRAPIPLPEVSVEGAYERPAVPQRSTTGTKTDTPLLDV